MRTCWPRSSSFVSTARRRRVARLRRGGAEPTFAVRRWALCTLTLMLGALPDDQLAPRGGPATVQAARSGDASHALTTSSAADATATVATPLPVLAETSLAIARGTYVRVRAKQPGLDIELHLSE